MARKKKVVPLTGLNCAALVLWLRTNIGGPGLHKEGHKSVMDAARWFCANLVAEDLADLSMRELAQAVLDPAPLKTAEDVTALLSGYAWDDTQSMSECLDAFNSQLIEFWGLE